MSSFIGFRAKAELNHPGLVYDELIAGDPLHLELLHRQKSRGLSFGNAQGALSYLLVHLLHVSLIGRLTDFGMTFREALHQLCM